MALKKKKTKKKPVKKAAPVFKLKRNVRMKSLDPAYVPRVRKELLDADYLKTLSDEDLRYYAQFMDEYVGGNVQKDKRGKVKAGHLHNTSELAKDCYDKNNKRNNDVHSVTKANGLLYNIDQVSHDRDGWYISNPSLTEDALIHSIETEDEDSDILSFDEFMKLRDNLTLEIKEQYEKLYASQLSKKLK